MRKRILIGLTGIIAGVGVTLGVVNADASVTAGEAVEVSRIESITDVIADTDENEETVVEHHVQPDYSETAAAYSERYIEEYNAKNAVEAVQTTEVVKAAPKQTTTETEVAQVETVQAVETIPPATPTPDPVPEQTEQTVQAEVVQTTPTVFNAEPTQEEWDAALQDCLLQMMN